MHRGLLPSFTAALTILAACPLMAQPERIPGRVDPTRRTALRGFTVPRAIPEIDRGPVDPADRLQSLSLMLSKTPAQQAALDRLLADQLDPASPGFHNWLTPEQFATRFGLSQADFDKVAEWLTGAGFSVDYSARGRNWMLFSGTAAQIQNAFQTQMRRYMFEGQLHYANATDPSVPEAIAPLVSFVQLNDFPMTAPRPKPLPFQFPANPAGPLYTASSGAHGLVPGDLQTIYD